MTAARTVKALASIAVITATGFFCGAHATCTNNGDEVDIDAGCSAVDDATECGLIGGDLYCLLDAIDGDLETCGDGCFCSRGVCFDSSTPFLLCENPFFIETLGTGGDPHMIGLQGQKIDWNGQDGGWYVLLSSDEDGVQISLRLTVPLPAEFPDRHIITGSALKATDGHTLVIRTKTPYTTVTNGCSIEVEGPCLSDGALEITVDGEDRAAVSLADVILPGGTVTTATNLPTACQPYGGDVIRASKFAEIAEQRRLTNFEKVDEWVVGWLTTTAAPSWCQNYIEDFGADGLLDYSSKYAVFRIATPSVTIRLHHGTNHQGGETLEDGRILPDLQFWQMDVHIEALDMNDDTLTGILGETMCPVMDSMGHPIMSGIKLCVVKWKTSVCLALWSPTSLASTSTTLST